MINNKSSGGIGFFGLLAIVLIALKIAGLTDISWLTIGLILCTPIILTLAIIAILGIFYVVKNKE